MPGPGFNSFSVLTLLMLMAMTVTSPAAPGPDLSQPYRRAERTLGSVHYLKPTETSASGLVLNLAPLLFMEDTVARTNFSAYPDHPGTVTSDSPKRLDMSRTTVYYSSSTLTTSNRILAQLTYEWRYPTMEKKGKPLTRLKWQGVRLTLDSQGHPVIWEVLNETQQRQVLFVARSLEEKAKAKFTNACPDRRFVIESPIETAPRAVVGGILEDGPVPMGPSVYVEQGTRDIVSVLCRCMPPQSTNVLTTSGYTLAPRPENGLPAPGGIKKPVPLCSVLRVLPD
jgi:hypothetical protein